MLPINPDATEYNIIKRQINKLTMYALLYGFAVLFIIPYIWMISTSLKPPDQVFSQIPYWVPREITLRWYQLVFTDTQIIRWTINTFVVSSVTTVLVVILDSMIAFSLTKLSWRGQKFIFSIIVASFMIPAQLNIIPLYSLINNLGLINNFWALILPFTAGPLGVFLFVQFFKDVPDDLIEAARIDGLSNFQIYFRIVLPLMKPAMAALGLFTFVWSWNRFLWPFIVMQQETAYTLPVGIAIVQPGQVYQPGAIMAASLIASLPLIIAYLFLQERLISAVQIQGGVK